MKVSVATTNAAMDDFMSAAPRPNNRPSRIVGTKGSDFHSSSGPVGTTSVWPAKQTSGRAGPRRAHRLVTSPRRIGSHLKSSFPRRSPIRSWQPPSSGVTDFRAMSSLASSSTASGIHVDLDVAELRAARGGEDAFLLLFLLPAPPWRRRSRRGGRRRRAGDLAGGSLVDQP